MHDPLFLVLGAAALAVTFPWPRRVTVTVRHGMVAVRVRVWRWPVR